MDNSCYNIGEFTNPHLKNVPMTSCQKGDRHGNDVTMKSTCNIIDYISSFCKLMPRNWLANVDWQYSLCKKHSLCDTASYCELTHCKRVTSVDHFLSGTKNHWGNSSQILMPDSTALTSDCLMTECGCFGLFSAGPHMTSHTEQREHLNHDTFFHFCTLILSLMTSFSNVFFHTHPKGIIGQMSITSAEQSHPPDIPEWMFCLH